MGGGELDAGEGHLGGARGEPARVEHPLARGRRPRSCHLAGSLAREDAALRREGIGVLVMSECAPAAGSCFRRLRGQGVSVTWT